MKFIFKVNKFFSILFLLIFILLIANCAARVVQFYYPDLVVGLLRTTLVSFDFNTEGNFPSYFSSLLLLLNSSLLFIIYYGNRKDNKKAKYWLIMSAVFCFLAMDEMLHIHEHLVEPTRAFLNTSGYFNFAWFIPYVIILFFLALYFYKFMFQLPQRTLKLFVLSLILFLFGAVGMEAIGGNFVETGSEDSITYFLMYTIEEFFEMTGSALFCYALINHVVTTLKYFTFDFSKSERPIKAKIEKPNWVERKIAD